MSYIPLHIHSQYSRLDGIIKFPELIQYCKQYNMPACALTDHGELGGIINFYKECKKHSIKPLIAVEAYITENPDDQDNKDKIKDNYHLILIAKNNNGYKKLLKYVSNANENNFYYKPRIYKEYLKDMAGDFICTTACLGSEIAKKGWLENNPTLLDWYSNIFGDDLYLELQDWNDGTNTQQLYNQWLLKHGRERHLPFVITSDAHYLRKEDYRLHELVMAMQFKKTLKEYRDEGKMQYGPYFYVKTPDEMEKSCQELDCPEACENTIKVAEKCNVEIPLGKILMPTFAVEEQEDYGEFLVWKENR